MANLLSWLGGVANGIGGQINRTANQVQRNVVNPAVNFGVRNVQQAQRNVAQLPANVQRGAFDLQQQANNARKQAEEEARRIAEQRTREIMSIGNQAQRQLPQVQRQIQRQIQPYIPRIQPPTPPPQLRQIQNLNIPRLANISADTARNVLGNIGKGYTNFAKQQEAKFRSDINLARNNPATFAVSKTPLLGAVAPFLDTSPVKLPKVDFTGYVDRSGDRIANTNVGRNPIVGFAGQNIVKPIIRSGARVADVMQGQEQYAPGIKGIAQLSTDAFNVGSLAYTPAKAGQLALGGKAALRVAPSAALRGAGAGAGISTLNQYADTGRINPTDVALSGLLGGVANVALPVAGGYAGRGLQRAGTAVKGLSKVGQAIDIQRAKPIMSAIETQKFADTMRKVTPQTAPDIPTKGKMVSQGYQDVSVDFKPKPVTNDFTGSILDNANYQLRNGQISEKQYKAFIVDDYTKRTGKLPTDEEVQGFINVAKEQPYAKLEQLRQQYSKPIAQDVPENPLFKEARKYKSAEEFVKNNFVAHGTNKEILGNLQPTNGWYGKAVYTTDDLANASGRNGGGVTYFVNKPQGKLLEINAHGSKGGSGFTPQQYQDAIKNGYDGLKIKHDDGKTWYAMFNEQTPHTKQQLTDLYNQAQVGKTKPIYELAPKPGKTPMKPGSDSFKTDTVENIIKDLKGVSQEFRDKVGSNINKNISVEEVPFSKLIRTKTPASKRLSSVEKLGSTDYVTVIKEGNRYRPVDGQHRIAVAENSGKSSLKMIVANSDSNMTTEQIKNQFGKAIAPKSKDTTMGISKTTSRNFRGDIDKVSSYSTKEDNYYQLSRKKLGDAFGVSDETGNIPDSVNKTNYSRLSQPEKDVITQYTSQYGPGRYSTVNEYLRTGKGLPGTDVNSKKLTEALNKSTIGANTVLYRGVESDILNDPSIIKAVKLANRMSKGDVIKTDAGSVGNIKKLIGTTITDAAPMSTSKYPSMYLKNREIILVIKTKASDKGLDITALSRYGGKADKPLPFQGSNHFESEVLLAPNTKLKVTDVEVNSNGVHLLTEVVPSKPIPKNRTIYELAPEPKTAKVSIAELQKNDTLGLMNTKDDIAAGRLSRTKGPVEVVKTSEGHLLIDGNHRALEAQMAGKNTVDAIVLSPEEAMKKYGDYLPQLKFVLDATGDLPVDKLNRPIYETAPKPKESLPDVIQAGKEDVYYHGTTKSDAESMLKTGFNPKLSVRGKNTESPYALFVSKDKGRLAGDHSAGNYGDGTIVKVTPNTDVKLLDGQSRTWVDSMGQSRGAKESAEWAKKLQRQGYDGIQEANGEITILNPSKFTISEVSPKVKPPTIPSKNKVVPETPVKLEAKKDRFGVPFKEESVPVAKLTRNQEYQPRIGQSGEATTANVFKKGYQEGLSDQPMLVRKEGDKYTVLGGHSRTMGIEQRAKAGLDNPTNIKARVYENITDEQARQISRGANQGAQYESTLDMAKSISASISENKAPSVQKQNMVKGFGHDDYKYLWDVVKDNNILKEKVNAGGISAEETLAIARQGRVKGLEPEKVAGVIQGLDKAGKLTRQNAKNVINLLSGKIKAGQMRTNQIGMFGDVEKAVKAVDLLDEYQKVSAELVKKRNALAIATDTLDKKSPAYKELRLKVKEYGQKLKTVETEVVNQYNAKISKNVPEIPSKTPPPPKPPTKKVRMNEYGELQVKERGFVTTVKNSPQTTPEVAKGVKGKYEPINNIDTLDTARKEVGLGKSGRVNNKKAYEEAIDTAKRSEDYSTETQAQSLILIEHLQSKGRTQDAIDIVEKMSERATKNGQASQILAAYNRLKPEGVLMMAQREIDKAKAMNPTKYANLKIEKVQAKKLRKMATELQGLTGDERIVAQKEMLDEIGRLVPTPNMTKAVTIWKAGLLTGIKGGVSGNAVGNASNILVKKIADAPASAIDTVITQFTGNRSKVFTLKGWLSGFGEGLKAGKKQIQLGTGADDLASKLDYKKVYFSKNNPAGRFAQKYTDFVFGFYSASDKPWKMAALKNSLTDLATVEAKNKGLKGAAKAKFIKETVEAPPDNLLVQATNDSLDATFQDATALGGMLSGAKRSLAKHGPVAGAVGEVVAPFTGIPSSVATKMYRYSLVSSAVDIVRAIKASNKGQFDQAAQRKVSESIGKGLTGTALLGTGYALWNAGLMTTGMPQDPKERDLWELEGKQPWSVKVGGEWLSLNYTGPVLAILGAGATAAQSIKEGNTLPQTAFIAGMGTAKAVLESSPLKGVQSTLDVISDPARNGPRYLESLAGSTIPTISADVASSIDPLQREAMSPLDAMTNRVPIWRYGLNPKLNPFGEPKANNAFGIQAIVDPFRMSEARTSSLTTELRNLYNTNKDLGTMPSDFKKDFYGGDTKLNEKQIYDLTAKIKPEIKQAWEQIIADPRYQGLNPEQRKKVLDKAAEDIRAARKFETGVQGGFLNEGEARKKLETGAKRILRGGQTDYINKETGGEDTPKQKYETALNDYEDKKKNGEISSIDEIKIQKALKKLQAQSNFDQDTVDLYGLSLKEIDGYLKSQPNGGDIYQKLLALDDAMEAAGATRKFKNRKLVVSSGKKSTKGRKAKKGGKAKKGTAIKIPSISGSAYKAPKFVTRKIASRKLSTKALPKIKAGKVYV